MTNTEAAKFGPAGSRWGAAQTWNVEVLRLALSPRTADRGVSHTGLLFKQESGNN